MSTIKVDTIATRTGSGNITASNTIAGTDATLSGTLGVTGQTTLSSKLNINFNGSATQAMHLKDTGGGNLASFGLYYNPSSTLIGNIQNANNAGIHLNVGNGSVCFTQTGYTAANALDDYEEGTWTATLGGLSSNPTVSAYAYNSGHYTKIGRQVFAHIYMRIENGNISGGSGDATILGLPFTSSATGAISNGAGAWIENYTYTANSFSSGRSYARPVMVAGENRMRLYQLSYSNPQQATGWSLGQADDAALMFGGIMVYMTA